MIGILVGIVLVLAGILFGIEGYTVDSKAETIMQQQYAATVVVAACILMVGGLLMIALGYGNIVASGLRREMIGFRKDLARMWELDQSRIAATERRDGAAATSNSPRPDIEVRPQQVGRR